VGKLFVKCSLERLRRKKRITLRRIEKMGCEDGRWMELDQNGVQWWVLVLAVLNLHVLLSL
jgi:hypothetical protein